MGNVTVEQGVHAKWFNDAFGDFDGETEIYHFKLRCILPYRRPPRHEAFEMTRDFGRNAVAKLLDEGKKLSGELVFVFPERWMNVREQQIFTKLLGECEGIKSVDLITISPLIISGIKRENIRILRFDDDPEDTE